MAIIKNGTALEVFQGDHAPVNVYYGTHKVDGYHEDTQTGSNLNLSTTYNDFTDISVTGSTTQQSEYVNKTGLLSQDNLAVNDEIAIPYRGYNLTYRIVNIDGEMLTLESKYVFGTSTAYKGLQYDAPEAFYYAESGLAAGQYNFKLLTDYDATYGGGKTYEFTLAQAVPIGGVLTFPWGYNVQASTVKVYSWASNSDITGIENVSVAEGTGGTALGEVNGTGNLNHTHRIRYGSNNYMQSAVRQWLNSAGALGAVWTPQTKFDRPPSWHTSVDAAYVGFQNGLDADFLAVVEEATIPYRTNSVHEVASLDATAQAINSVYSLSDKFFLLSRPEIYGDWDSATYKDGEYLDYYNGLTNTERIKYDAFSTARYAWLRSPYPGHAYHARLVHTDGSLDYGGAYISYGVAPACKIKISNLQTLIDNETISYTHASPSPSHPQPLVSNLPAGTYYTTDYKGDKYDFTLAEDLCGIGDVKDSIEFDKYSHGGFERREYFKTVLDGVTDGKKGDLVNTVAPYYYTRVPILAASKGMVKNSHFIVDYSNYTPNHSYATEAGTYAIMFHTDQSLDTLEKWNTWLAAQYSAETPVTFVCKKITPTRTPLTFTLNNSSTAPECPMEFLTDTPSLEYPATVWDASGTVKVANADDSQNETATIPTLRSNAAGTIYDEYNVTTGVVTRKMSEWMTLGGDRVWISGQVYQGYRNIYLLQSVFGNMIPSSNTMSCIKYNSVPLTASYNIGNPSAADTCTLGAVGMNIGVGNADSGWSDAYVPTTNEIKAYFYGWRLCHASGLSPYYKSEVPYTPTTWAEWTKTTGVVGDSTGLEFTANGSTKVANISTTLKVNTKYGFLYNVVGSTITGILYASGSNMAFINVSIPKVVGNNKHVVTSASTITDNKFQILLPPTETVGNKIKIKDIRVYELPTGSTIEADFATKTADELAIKYPFDGLNVKYWEHIVGTDAEKAASRTSVLPTASYTGYTPYKMMYELAVPQMVIGSNSYPINTLPIGTKYYDFVGNDLYQNVGTHNVAATDVTALVTSYVNLDWVKITKPADAVYYGSVAWSGNWVGKLSLGYATYDSNFDNAAYVGKANVNIENATMWYGVAKGAYADLTAAKAGIGGKMSYDYLLTTPVFKETITPDPLPTYYPTTVVTTTNNNAAALTTTVTAKIRD